MRFLKLFARFLRFAVLGEPEEETDELPWTDWQSGV